MSNQQQETTARQPSDAAVEAAMTRLAAWVFADDPKADFSFDGVDADDKADALNAARVALEAAYRVDVPRSTPALHVTDGAVDYLGRWKWGQSYDTESPHQHEQSIAFAHEALEGLLPLLGPRPMPTHDQIEERLADAMADSWMGDAVDCADVAAILTPTVLALLNGEEQQTTSPE